MINCPRCGFLQPEDRFCASCGLDILNFKPKPRPWVSRVLRSPLFQAFTSLGIVIAILFFIFRSQTSQIETRVNEAVRPSAQAPDIGEDETSANDSEPANAMKDRTAAPALAQQQPEASTAQDAAAEQAPGANPAKLPESAEVNFLEVPRDQLAAVLQDAKTASLGPNIQVFYLPNVDKLSTLVQLAHKLPGGFSVHFKETGDQHQYLVPIAGTESAYGLSLAFYPPAVAPNERFAIRVVGTSIGLQKGSAEPVRSQIDDSLITAPDQPAVLVGLIPNNLTIPGPPNEIADSPMSVINSQPFQQNLTDAVITVQFPGVKDAKQPNP
jgi:hypothetical protein